ncbi:hypothetical protein [Ureibacillus sp. GCM10028918]|uniref:hypothetical protein n=1 Tax=Ureibacillus sp. GCM10028918 TaxID=3273429 RepID=UPI00361C2076
MKKGNKVWIYFLTVLLSIGLFGTSILPVHAHEDMHKFHEEYDKLDDAAKAKVDESLSTLKSDLKEMGLEVPQNKFHEQMKNLDKETQENVKAIFKQVKENKMTKEEADKKLAELGVDPPKHKECKVFENLDEETKEKVKAIFKDQKEGNITKEEAHKKLAELGIEMPKHPMNESFEKLDDATKAKVKERVEQAKSELEQLGVSLPKKFEFLTQ